jgi:hypothetical protein
LRATKVSSALSPMAGALPSRQPFLGGGERLARSPGVQTVCVVIAAGEGATHGVGAGRLGPAALIGTPVALRARHRAVSNRALDVQAQCSQSQLRSARLGSAQLSSAQCNGVKLVDVLTEWAHPSERGAVFARRAERCAFLVATFTSSLRCLAVSLGPVRPPPKDNEPSPEVALSAQPCRSRKTLWLAEHARSAVANRALVHLYPISTLSNSSKPARRQRPMPWAGSRYPRRGLARRSPGWS